MNLLVGALVCWLFHLTYETGELSFLFFNLSTRFKACMYINIILLNRSVKFNQD